jgi:hypothetical protein
MSKTSSSRRSKLSAAQLALLEKRLRGEADAQIAPAIPARTVRTDSAPLSFAQQRLWFLDQSIPHRVAYNIAMGVRLFGPLNIAALRLSLNTIVERHDVLRTTFAAHDGHPVQVISPEANVEMPLEDLSALDEAARESKLALRASEEAGVAFDLQRGPLCRFRLLRLGKQAHALFLTMHHIISDGWSTGILVRELTTLYNALAGNQSPRLPDLPIQYADYALWQREWLQSGVLERQLAYWRKQLGGTLTLLELPTDRQRRVVQTYQGGRHKFSLSPDLTDQLKALSREEGATLYMTLLAAFKVLLHRYTRQDEILVGTPIASRDRAEIEPLIGLFVNMLVLRTQLDRNETFRQALRRVKETALSAYEHKDVPFEKLIEDLHPARILSQTPLFQVTFQLQNAAREMLELAGLKLTSLGNEFEAAKFDLTLLMAEKTDMLTGLFRYNKDLFAEATIRRMQSHFQVLLQSIVSYPDDPLSALQMSSEQERRQLVANFNEKLG